MVCGEGGETEGDHCTGEEWSRRVWHVLWEKSFIGGNQTNERNHKATKQTKVCRPVVPLGAMVSD